MKPTLFVSACGLVLASASACAPTTPPAQRTALDCPATQGDLTRASVSADQKTCLYTTRDGDEVSLRLIPAASGYVAALQPIEQELQSELPSAEDAAAAKAVAGDAKAAAAEAKAAAKDAKAEAAEAKAGASEAAKAARQAAEDALGDARQAERDAREAKNDDSGEGHAHIDLPGIHINADENGKADVNVGMIHVNAGENGAVVRIARDVRLRGEAFAREKRGFRATYILAQDDLKDGWKAVGYEAGGPKTGPVTVAVVKAKPGDHHDVFNDVKRLVRKNGGV